MVFHDEELASGYRPVLFSHFAAHAGRHGLHFVSMQMPGPVDPSYRAEIVSSVRQRCGDDRTAEEQLMDPLRTRRYRPTLLCRAEVPVVRDIGLNGLKRVCWNGKAGAKHSTKSSTQLPQAGRR